MTIKERSEQVCNIRNVYQVASCVTFEMYTRQLCNMQNVFNDITITVDVISFAGTYLRGQLSPIQFSGINILVYICNNRDGISVVIVCLS